MITISITKDSKEIPNGICPHRLLAGPHPYQTITRLIQETIAKKGEERARRPGPSVESREGKRGRGVCCVPHVPLAPVECGPGQ
ncbi:hypothetical protein TNIN_219321 [Trichonephila inaurata madagascariensis]|uniref:Uncharacterized protein n=1 Tax=Trichonephila inaurata madagascariensis TaxID=2747483 RepID=A0A8X6YHM0_9ARAC|nr:hypothetical protein TNIN_219321 [Trichonephila inaurata madagascariensis]